MIGEIKKECDLNRAPFSANNFKIGINPEPQRYDYIPIDFVKAEVIELSVPALKKNVELDFIPVLSKHGVIKHEYAVYQNLKLKIYPNDRIFLSGSIHKFFNNGEHNANDFSQSDFEVAIQRIKNEIGINPENLRIIRLEYGVNIEPPISTTDILNGCLQYSKKDIEIRLSNDRAKYHGAKLSNFELKIYDKAKQYKLPNQLLRIEVKVTNWTNHRKKGISTLKDWIFFDKTEFVERLINTWNSIIFSDPTIKPPDKWHKYGNAAYWRDLGTYNSRTTYKRHLDRLKSLNLKYGEGVQVAVSQCIENKIKVLQGVTNFTFSPKRKCLLTGIPIDGQRNDSILLSHEGLKELQRTDRETFFSIKRKYLTSTWTDSDFKTQIREIAHNIRNSYFNKLRNIDPNQMKLDFN